MTRSAQADPGAPGGASPGAMPAGTRCALWSLGFRPFYLLASIFAAVSILVWIAEYAGWLPVGYLRNPVWHAHEMLFGYTTAVIAGFLFTAGRNWTGQATPTGRLLAGYALLWFAGVADQFEVVLQLQQLSHAAAQQRVVVDDQDTGGGLVD